MLVREKHLLNAQLTVARQIEPAEAGISKVQDLHVDRTLDQSTVHEYTPVLTAHSKVPQYQSQRHQINSSGYSYGTEIHPSIPRGDVFTFGKLYGQAQEQGQGQGHGQLYDRSVIEDMPPVFPYKIGQQSAPEHRPTRADPVNQSKAELEGRWSARQTLSQRTGPPQSSSSLYTSIEESMPDLNALSRDSFKSDIISRSRSRGQSDVDREGHTQERVMTSSEFVKHIKARRKISQ